MNKPTFLKFKLFLFGLFTSVLCVQVNATATYEDDFSNYYTYYEDRVSEGYYGLRIRGTSSGPTTVILPYDIKGCRDVTFSFDYRTRGLDGGEVLSIDWSPIQSDYMNVGSISDGSGEFSYNTNSSRLTIRFRFNASSYFERVDIDNLIITGEDNPNCPNGICECSIMAY